MYKYTLCIPVARVCRSRHCSLNIHTCFASPPPCTPHSSVTLLRSIPVVDAKRTSTIAPCSPAATQVQVHHAYRHTATIRLWNIDPSLFCKTHPVAYESCQYSLIAIHSGQSRASPKNSHILKKNVQLSSTSQSRIRGAYLLCSLSRHFM